MHRLRSWKIEDAFKSESMKGCADHAPARWAKRPAASFQGIPEPKHAKITPDFRTRCESLAHWVRDNEHLPKEKSENEEENRYARWLNNFLQCAKVKLVSDDERRQLSTIPGMKDRLQRWDDRL